MDKNVNRSITPEELFPNGPDALVINGVKIRKGTIASSIKNAAIIDDEDASFIEKEKAWEYLKEALPKLEKAFNISQIITWNNPRVNELTFACYI